jgi:hypothetical protein
MLELEPYKSSVLSMIGSDRDVSSIGSLWD